MFDAQPHWLFRGRVSDDFASSYKTPLHSTYLWWSRSPAPGKSPSCSPDLAAASQSLDEWFCQSTTWWGRERKHGTHGTRLVRGEVGACGRKDEGGRKRGWVFGGFRKFGETLVFAFQMQRMLMPAVRQLLTWTLESVWDDWKGRRQKREVELLQKVSLCGSIV